MLSRFLSSTTSVLLTLAVALLAGATFSALGSVGSNNYQSAWHMFWAASACATVAAAIISWRED